MHGRPVAWVAITALGLGASSEPAPSAQLPAVAIGVLVVHVGLVAVHHDWRVAVGVWWTLNGVAVAVAAVDERITDPDGTTTVESGRRSAVRLCSLRSEEAASPRHTELIMRVR